MSAIEVDNLHFAFGTRWVLQGISLRVEQGSVAVIFGPNGAGKTTLLKILACLMKPAQGIVRIEGVDAVRDPDSVRRLIGVISHQPYLYPRLSGIENLEYYARMYGLGDARGLALRMIDEMGLSSVAGREVGTYSRGMQQRLAVARALLHEPRVLLLDEPFTGLDHEARQRLGELLRGLRDGQRTVLMTTHDVDEGLSLSDRIAVLARGRIVLEGDATPTDREAFLERYREAVSTTTARGGETPPEGRS